jgi:glycosyltransferase involved in cell wall biosynthesis
LRKKGVKVISIADNIVPHEKRPGDTLLTRYFIRSVDGFVVMSAQVGKDLDRFDPLKPRRFNPHPLFDNFGDPIPKSEARQTLGIDPSAPLILFFGFIRDYKGLDLLLEAMAREDFTNRSAKLLIAGEFYTDPGPYRQLINDPRLAGRVILHDRFIADHEVSCYFSAADLVVQPYRHATQSGVTQIAYHFDKPMIVTDVGGLPEMIPDGVAGYVVPAEPAAIAKAIERFYQEEKEIIFTGNIKREKLKFSWGKMASAILDLGRDII